MSSPGPRGDSHRASVTRVVRVAIAVFGVVIHRMKRVVHEVVRLAMIRMMVHVGARAGGDESRQHGGQNRHYQGARHGRKFRFHRLSPRGRLALRAVPLSMSRLRA